MFWKTSFRILLFAMSFLWLNHQILAQCTNADSVFISEFHYDNSGADVNEFVEITGPAGIDLSCFQIILYNGSTGQVYNTVTLSGTIDDEGCGYGAVAFFISGIQNGAPDGIVLYNQCSGTVIQFLSYEGSFTAVNGPANGMSSVDIGVDEAPPGASNESLQLTGTGQCYSGIVSSGGWIGPSTNSADNLNPGLDICLSPLSPDTLRFHITSTCIEENEIASITVCAETYSNMVVTSYNGIITISKVSGPGNLSGSLTQTAVNGCASFNISFDQAGTYILSASDGTLVGQSDNIIVEVAGSCPTCPQFRRILVNSCGGQPEGINEYVSIQNGSSDLDINAIEICFPNGGCFCNLGCGLQTWVSNIDFVNQLNTTAGCPLFVDALSAGTIPAGATIVVFTGDTPTYNFDFSPECGNGPYYALFANNDNTSGRFVNTAPCGEYRTLTGDFSGGCTDTVTYEPCQLSNTDGDMVLFDDDGNPSYTNDPDCALILPLTQIKLHGYLKNGIVHLQWQLPPTIPPPANFAIEMTHFSFNDPQFLLISPFTENQYSYTVQTPLPSPYRNYAYVRIKGIYLNGGIIYSNWLELKEESISLQIFPNPFSSSFNLTGPNHIQGSYIIATFDGKILAQNRFTSLNDLEQQLNRALNNASAGFFLLTLPEYNLSYKLIKGE